MTAPFRKQVKITKLPELPATSRLSALVDAEARERDSRPGRFTVKGTFIKLPERDETKSDPPAS